MDGQTDRLTDGQGKKCKNTLCCMGQAQGTQAVQRQAGLEHSASYKAVFLSRTKKIKIKTTERIHRNVKVGKAHLGIC